MTLINLDKAKCTNCGLCAQACPSLIFEFVEKKSLLRENSHKDCIQCGQCIAVCGDDAITVEGLDPNDFAPLPVDDVNADRFAAMSANRRSVRAYKKKPVPPEVVQRAIEIGAFAPVSFPPWLVEVTTVLGREKIDELSDAVATVMDKMVDMNHHFISRFFIKRAVGAERYKFLDEFFIPVMEEGLQIYYEQHVDIILRAAPGVMLFHASPDALEPNADCWLAAAHTALAMQSLGLGVCFNGLVTAAAKTDKTIKPLLSVPKENEIHAAFTFGYPRFKYKKSIKRPFKSSNFLS